MTTEHNKVFGLSCVTGSWFLESEAVEIFKCILGGCEHHNPAKLQVRGKICILDFVVNCPFKAFAGVVVFLWLQQKAACATFPAAQFEIGLNDYNSLSFIHLSTLAFRMSRVSHATTHEKHITLFGLQYILTPSWGNKIKQNVFKSVEETMWQCWPVCALSLHICLSAPCCSNCFHPRPQVWIWTLTAAAGGEPCLTAG